MDKLLESLISKAKLECEEAHRQLLFAFNGLYMISLGRRGGLMVSVLNPGLDVPGSSPGWGQDSLLSQCFSSPRVQMGTSECAGGNPAMD